jgi:hypothetical protein
MDLTMMERVGDRCEKNGRILFDRPKPTVGCSASGRRRRSYPNLIIAIIMKIILYLSDLLLYVNERRVPPAGIILRVEKKNYL